jgi:hypothetical protein
MTTQELRSKIKDVFSFILLGCPDFPPSTKTSIKREFDELKLLIESILQKTDKEERRQWIINSLNEIAISQAHYEKGNKKAGMYHIQRGEEYFDNYCFNKQLTARFISGQSGPSDDTENGFPS